MSKITEFAKTQPCIRCGRNKQTTRCSHYNGIRQILYGKGRGIKCHDVASADLCFECDQEFSEGVNVIDDKPANKSLERSEEFLNLVTLSNIRRADAGVI